jgi:IS30 family transposase
MGGDRTCPDDCPFAVWQGLSSNDRKTKRKPIAERLYQQGFTMEVIATQLGVSKYTISMDLRNCLVTKQLKPAKTATNPKGAGRPKGKTKPRPKVTDPHKDQIVAMHDTGSSHADIAGAVGLHERVVGRLLQDEQIRREAEPLIDAGMLSLSAQQKLDIAVRQAKRKLDLEFEARVSDEVKRRIDQIILPHWKEKIAQAQKLYRHRKGAMDKATFNKIRRALHPDSRKSISDKMLGDAFDTFMSLEKYLLDEKESPTDFSGLPETWDDWQKAKQRATAERRARRAGGESSALRRA